MSYARSTVWVSVEAAIGWIDTAIHPLGLEAIDVGDAVGRILARDAVAFLHVPGFDRAAVDGLAVRAEDTLGASAYNPLRFRRGSLGEPLQPTGAALLNAGDRLPPGSDAVVPLAYIEADATGAWDLIQEVAPGAWVERKASQCTAGDVLLKEGRQVAPYDLGVLVLAEVSRVDVVRRPSVLCVVLCPAVVGATTDHDRQDVNGKLLLELVRRDGGTVTVRHSPNRDARAISGALTGDRADLVIVAGGTGAGENDHSAAALATVGEVALHGIALQPGETAGLGRLSTGTPVCLLPGAPAACLCAYEFLAGRAVRLLGGRSPALPLSTCRMSTTRKINSVIGMTEVVPVRSRGDGRVEPIASFADFGLGAVTAADGLVVVPEGSEGVPEGSDVEVHLYRTPMQ